MKICFRSALTAFLLFGTFTIPTALWSQTVSDNKPEPSNAELIKELTTMRQRIDQLEAELKKRESATSPAPEVSNPSASKQQSVVSPQPAQSASNIVQAKPEEKKKAE